MSPRTLLRAAGLGAALAAPVQAQDVAAQLNDFPTVARADYIFGCMAVNGQGRDVLEKCACSIDHIASVLPYDRYVEAETVLSLGLVSGERGAMFRGSPVMRNMVAAMRRAQAEAEIICFRP